MSKTATAGATVAACEAAVCTATWHAAHRHFCGSHHRLRAFLASQVEEPEPACCVPQVLLVEQGRVDPLRGTVNARPQQVWPDFSKLPAPCCNVARSLH